MSAPKLRPTRPNDVEKIMALVDSIYHEYGCYLDLEDEPYWAAPGPYFRKGGGEFWVLEAAGEIVGTVALKLEPESAELKCLYLHPRLRRQGWATRLVRMIEAEAQKAGYDRLKLWSDTRFLGAHALYQKLDYQQQGFRDLQDNNQTKEYGFERRLS